MQGTWVWAWQVEHALYMSWQEQESDPEHSKVSNSEINLNTDPNTRDICHFLF